jgi:hypothetical protein
MIILSFFVPSISPTSCDDWVHGDSGDHDAGRRLRRAAVMTRSHTQQPSRAGAMHKVEAHPTTWLGQLEMEKGILVNM